MKMDKKMMNGKDGSWFPRPEFIIQAAKESKGRLLFVEILIFILMWMLFCGGEFVGYLFLHTLLKGMGLTGSALPDWADIALNNLMFGIGGLAILFYCRIVEKRRFRTMGFVRQSCGKEFLLGFVAGGTAFTVCALFALLLGVIQSEGMGTVNWLALILILLSYVLQATVEEIVFRGYFMVSVSRRYPLWLASLISAVMFAAIHLKNPGAGLMVILNVFLIGLFLSMIILKRGNIWVACGFHTMWNFTQGNIFGMSVSGFYLSDNTIFKFTSASGNSLFTGGDFGLEATLETTIITVLLIIWVSKLPAIDRSKEIYGFLSDTEREKL